MSVQFLPKPMGSHLMLPPTSSQLPLDTTPLQCLPKLWPVFQCLLRLRIPHPSPPPLMLLRPLVLFLVHARFKELIFCLGRMMAHLLRLARISDHAEVAGYRRDDTGFLPGLPLGCILGRCLVELPSALWEYPSTAAHGLYEKDFFFGGRESDDAADQALAGFGEAYSSCVLVSLHNGSLEYLEGAREDRMQVPQDSILRWLSRPVRAVFGIWDAISMPLGCRPSCSRQSL